MKIISLNAWGGIAFKSLIDFIKQQAQTTDIFCFQEIYQNDLGIKQLGKVRANLLKDLQNVLKKFKVYYYPVIRGYDLDGTYSHKVNFDVAFGLGLFVKDSIKVKSTGQRVLYDDKTGILKADFSNLPVYLQFLDFESGSKDFIICNFHGIPKPGNKLDTPARIDQSKKILNFLSTKKSAQILTGDFNLMPNTQSIHLLEEKLTNLIEKYNIKITRSRLSPFWGKRDFQSFADYTFVSKDVQVKNFEVPDVEISDHLPMILELSTPLT